MARRTVDRSYIPIKDVQFANWGKRFAAKVQEDAAALGITADMAAELVAAADDFRDQLLAQMRLENLLKGQTKLKNKARAEAESLARTVAQLIRANPAVSDGELVTLTLSPRKKRSRVVRPRPPTDLFANPNARGYVDLKWNSARNKQGTTYIVERRFGTDGPFEFVAATSKTSFRHMGQTPGVEAQYRVHAQRTSYRSGYTHPATIYSPGSQQPALRAA